MKRVVILPSFERSFKKLTAQKNTHLAKSLENFNTFLTTGKTSPGFRFKKISHDKYEFRSDIRIRIVVKEDHEVYYLVLAGNHDDIRRYLKNYR